MKPYAPGLNVMCEGSEGASDLSNWRRSFPRLCDGLRDKKRSMLSPRALLSGVDGAGKFSEKDENPPASFFHRKPPAPTTPPGITPGVVICPVLSAVEFIFTPASERARVDMASSCASSLLEPSTVIILS
jgi:hypothetical protein